MKLSKAYEPQKYEKKIYQLWEEQGLFAPKNRGSEKSFSIVVPPPNANGDLHIGHGLNMAIMDIATRYHRMKGEAALLLPGADHAGLETWVVYEKQLVAQGKSRFDFTREELYKQIWDFVALNKDNYQEQFRKLGASVDWDRYVYTLDQKIVDQAYTSFEKMWEEGLIYRAEKLVNYCTYHGTGFSDIEVDYRDAPGNLWYITYPLTDGAGEITVATTRPETMLGDVAVAVHPDDKRFGKFVGKTVTLPLTGREVPILADDFVDPEYGTGAVKITPAHDQNDFDMAERHKLDKITVISLEGKMTDNVPKEYAGLEVLAAREKVVADLTEQGVIVKTEDISHSVAHCYKCGTVIEPLLKEQWFINVKPLAKEAITALKDKKVAFQPDTKRKQLITYLENLRDWNISRQIAWGIPIPAFQNVDNPSDWIFNSHVEQETITKDGKTYRRDPDVFDTWFSSASWPYSTLDFPDGKDFDKFYPLSLMETGADILYPWVSRMVMFGIYNTGKIPFNDVYLHGLIQDPHGQKMSKSKGNVVNPMEKVDEFGSDAFRIGIIMGESAGNDRPYDETKVVGARNFCNKLWNIARFVQEQTEGKEVTEAKPETAADHWVLSKLQQTITSVSTSLENYRFSEAYDQLYHFVWDNFADWYIEASKSNSNVGMLAFVLEDILLLAHPFAPFVTETIWQEMGKHTRPIIISKWPYLPESDAKLAKEFESVIALITEARGLVKAMSLSKPVLLHDSPEVEENKDIISRMARLGSVEKTEQGTGFQLTSTKLTAWLDVDEEALKNYKDDLHKQSVELSETIQRFEQRLSNKGYIESAPEKVVQQTRDQLADAQIQLELLETELNRFK